MWGASGNRTCATTFFFTYINDIPLKISSNVRLFADDYVIYRKIMKNGDLLKLQNDIAKVTDMCTTWQMFLNTTKCKCMRFSRSSSAVLNPTLLLNGTPLEFTNQYKYLVLHLSSNLTWNTHIDKIVESAN